MTETVLPPTIVRRNHGRNHTYQIDGQKVPGVTTILGGGYPKPAIANWAAKTAAQEVLDHWDTLAQLAPSERYEQVRTAPNRDRDAAARRGTEVHRLAEQLAAGQEIDVPDELEGHVDAYLRFADEWQPRELHLEATVANLRWRYCGTVDAIADLADGNRWLYDLKTTRSGVFAEGALQVTAYRHAEWILAGDTAEPMPPVDQVGVVWLRADRSYDLIPIDASEATFRVFLHARAVYEFTQHDDGPIGLPLEHT